MTNKRTTRQALLMSLLSMLLCLSMLVGTTFAWFTDSVTSKNNIIVSGNLDVELEYSKDLNSWKTVQDATDLFSDELWEPGHTEVVYLKLSNVGTLALKYTFQMNFTEEEGINVLGDSFKLSQHLKYDIVEVDSAFANRDAAREAVKNSAKTLAAYSVNGTLAAETSGKPLALVVYMPEEVDNKANHKTGTAAPVIELGLNLFATQLANEHDSFGNDYDDKADDTLYTQLFTFDSTADLAAFEPSPADATDNTGLSIENGEAVINESGAWFTPETNLAAESYTLSYDLDITDLAAGQSVMVDTGEQTKWGSSPTEIVRGSAIVYFGTSRNEEIGTLAGTNLKVTHTYSLNAEDKLVITTAVTDGVDTLEYSKTFAYEAGSELYWDIYKITEAGKATMDNFCITATPAPVNSASKLAAALAEGGTVKLSENITTDEVIEIPEGVEAVLDLNGKTITGTAHKDDGPVIKNNGTMTIIGGTVKSTADNGGSAIVNNGTLTVEDATLNGAPNADGNWPSYTVNNTGVMTIKNCDVTSVHGGFCSYGDGAVLTLINTDLDMSGIPGFTSHGIYTYSNGKVIVNGGNIANNADDQNTSGASVINGAVEVNSGNFTGRIENYYGTPVLMGGTYSVKPNAKFVPEGFDIIDNGDGTYTVEMPGSTVNDAIKNAASGDTVTLPTGEFTLSSLSAKEGITIEGTEGTVIGGESATTGFGSNFGKNNTYENLTFKGTSNGARWTYGNGGELVFNNCTFEGDVYGFHMDESNGATIIFNNCTFTGFNAFAGDLVKVTFNDCTFNKSGYGHTNIWSVGEFNDCTWTDGTSVSPAGSSAKLYFDGVEESYHHEFVGSVDSLVAFKDTVADGDTWKGQKVVLVDDIKLRNVEWAPAGSFAGTFDGNGHTISYLTMSGTSNVGFFKSLSATAVVENVVFDHADISGEHYVGVVVGWEGNETYNATINNVTVQNSTITCNTDANDDNGDKAGAIAGYAVTLTVENCTVKDTTIKAYRDFGGILGYANGSKVIVRNNTIDGVTLEIDNDVNYKNYTTDAEHDGNSIVGEAAGNAVVENNTVK